MRSAQLWAPLLISIALAACTHNVANIRTFAASAQVVTGDTSDIVLADEANCEQKNALLDEFKHLMGDPLEIDALPCAELTKAGEAILVETKALQAYAQALNSVAQDQFVTADADGDTLTKTLQGTKVVTAPVATAVGSLFSLVETAALSGYRQRELTKVMTGQSAADLKTVMASYTVLVAQYSGSLDRAMRNIDLMEGALQHQEEVREKQEKRWNELLLKLAQEDKKESRKELIQELQSIREQYESPEPVAVSEMKIRLTAIQLDLRAKSSAVEDFGKAVAALNPAFDAAVKDLEHPSLKDFYADVKAFASQVKDAHDKLKKAFG
jgi:hypothetical protein